MSKQSSQQPPLPPSAKRAKLFLYLLIIGIVVLNYFLWRAASDLPETKPQKPSTNSATPFRPEPSKAVYATYAGSASCRECHAEAYELWSKSNHAQAERALDPVADQTAFAPARTVKHGSQTSEVRLARGGFELFAKGVDGQAQAFPIERVIGVQPLRQCLVPMPGGRYQVTELAWDPGKSEWFDVFGNEDRTPGEWGHWTGRGMTWNVMCAACHNTRVRKQYQPLTDTYATEMAEMGVGCEACHGPMADHVAWQRKQPTQAKTTAKKQDPTLRKFTREQWLDACGACHSRRAELTGDFVPGERFLDHYALTIPDETDLYYPDGQVRDENYEFASFLSSRMHAGGVSCWDCHNVHTAKVPTTENMLCLRCHGGQQANAPVINATAHSFHKPGTDGDRCVDCHMPLTAYMQRHLRRDHGFTIPDPLLTKQHGIPNACGRCHQEKSLDWQLEAVEKWYGRRMERPTRSRAQVVAQARAGQEGAVTNLVQLTGHETNALWRAVATGLLRPWAHQPEVTKVLLEKSGDPVPLVRAMAARGLEPIAGQTNGAAVLTRLLQDPVRVVRVDAAWALRSRLDTNSAAGQDLEYYLGHNADMPSALLQSGIFHLDRGAGETALHLFRKAVSLDGGSAPLRHALAVALSAEGKTEAAVHELEAACQLAPRDAEMRFKLGLAYNEAGRPADALAALESAVKLEPRFGQAWYNLGLAYSARQQPEAALEALAKAEALSPDLPQIPYARATILARLERVEEARVAARRALEIQPAYAEALALFQVLSARKDQ